MSIWHAPFRESHVFPDRPGSLFALSWASIHFQVKTHNFLPDIKKNPPRLLSPGGFLLNDLIVVTCFGYKTLTAINRFFTSWLERNSRIFSASSANSWEHLAFLTAIATATLVSGLCFFSCTTLRATSRFKRTNIGQSLSFSLFLPSDYLSHYLF